MRKFFLLMALLALSEGFAQNVERKRQWETDRPLTWADFQGSPNPKISFHASTNSGISFSWSYKSSGDGTEFVYAVESSFYPDLSWVKAGKGSEHLLAHEQLHFDISELHARKFRKTLEAYEITETIKEDLSTLYKKNEEARKRMQEAFDAETKHSQNKEIQEKWLQYVRAELEELKEYSL